MADFIHSGWGVYVTVMTLVSVLLCFLLAWLVSRARAAAPVDGQVETTGHVWDSNLQELNNPLPRWWLYLFYRSHHEGLFGKGQSKPQLIQVLGLIIEQFFCSCGTKFFQICKLHQIYDPTAFLKKNFALLGIFSPSH